MQHETPPDPRPLPEKTAAILRATQALLNELALSLPLPGLLCNGSIVSCGAGTRDVVEGKLRESRDILHRKEAELVQVLVGSVGYYCHDSKVRLARVVDEPGGTSHEFSINFVGFSQVLIFVSPVGKFIHAEEVQVLARGRIFTAAVGFLRGDDLANIAVNKLTFPDILSGTNPYSKC